MRAVGAIVSFLLAAGSAAGQPADTAKFQPAILNLRACLRANAAPIYIAKETNSAIDVFSHFQKRCYAPYETALAALGASDVAFGSFRLLVNQEWSAFLDHAGSR